MRKHLSRVKGGRLASATEGLTVALALSDVVGDDPAVIASGPTVADPTTYAEAMAVLERFGGAGAYPPSVVRALREGLDGFRPDTPKAGSVASRATTLIVGRQRDALQGARREALSRGTTSTSSRFP